MTGGEKREPRGREREDGCTRDKEKWRNKRRSEEERKRGDKE